MSPVPQNMERYENIHKKFNTVVTKVRIESEQKPLGDIQSIKEYSLDFGLNHDPLPLQTYNGFHERLKKINIVMCG